MPLGGRRKRFGFWRKSAQPGQGFSRPHPAQHLQRADLFLNRGGTCEEGAGDGFGLRHLGLPENLEGQGAGERVGVPRGGEVQALILNPRLFLGGKPTAKQGGQRYPRERGKLFGQENGLQRRQNLRPSGVFLRPKPEVLEHVLAQRGRQFFFQSQADEPVFDFRRGLLRPP